MKISEILTEKNSNIPHIKAYDEGVSAAEHWHSTHGANKEGSMCPYAEESEEARAWKKGWHDTYVGHVNFDGDD
jgi:hypothetical protein